MSCNNIIPLQTVADQVATILAANYVDKDDPRITNGVFTSPSIRGEFLLDAAAKDVFCNLVQNCVTAAPFGKTWLDRPVYPDAVLVSYEEAGQTKYKWSRDTELVPGKMLLPVPPAPDSLAVSYTDAGETKVRWEDIDAIFDSNTPEMTDRALRTLPKEGGVGRTQEDVNAEVAYIGDFPPVLGETDQTQGLQRLFDYCAANGKKAIINRECLVSDTVYASCNLDGTDGKLIFPPEYKKTGLVYAAEKSETTNIRLTNKTAIFPDIMTEKTSLGWDSVAGSVAIKIVNAMVCSFTINPIAFFQVGVMHLANQTDSNYNYYSVRSIVFCERNLVVHVNGAGSVASANQNIFSGGRFALASAEGGAGRAEGTRLIHLLITGDSSSSINNNTFINSSLEGFSDEYAILFENAGTGGSGISYNTLINTRLETGGVAGKKVGFKGARVRWNNFIDGYGVSAAVIEETEGAGSNSFSSALGPSLRTGTTIGEALLMLQNSSSGTAPALTVFGPTTPKAGLADPNNATFILDSASMQMGGAADTVKRLKVASGQGTVSWGSGATTHDVTLRRKSPAVLECGGKFVATAGIGVGGTSDATTAPAEPPTKKMPIYDDAGALLGYIPIYATIA